MKRYMRNNIDDNKLIQQCIKAIQSNTLDYDDDIDAFYFSAGPLYVQFQDRSSNTTAFSDRTYRKLDKQPRVKSMTWARIWINDNLVKKVDAPKMVARDEIIRYLKSPECSELLSN